MLKSTVQPVAVRLVLAVTAGVPETCTDVAGSRPAGQLSETNTCCGLAPLLMTSTRSVYVTASQSRFADLVKDLMIVSLPQSPGVMQMLSYPTTSEGCTVKSTPSKTRLTLVMIALKGPPLETTQLPSLEEGKVVSPG